MGKNYNSSRLVNGLFVDASGNVAVNDTTASGYRLKVNGTLGVTGAATFSSSVTAGGLITGQAGIYQANASLTIASNKFETYNGGATEMNFRYPVSGAVNFQNGTSRFYINSSGNVGIGTSSPSRGLHLNRDADAAVFLITKANNNVAFLGSGSSSSGAGTENAILQMYHNGTEYIRLYTQGNSWITGGNVGIGTSSPTTNANYRYLTIMGGQTDQGGVVDLRTSNSSSNFQIWADSTGANLNATTSHPMIFYTAGSERMRITNSGYVLVGYTSPPSVAGLFQTTSAYVGSLGTGIVYSLSGVLTSTNPSDLRLKDNVEDLGYGLKEILQLRPVKYNWKNDNANQGKQFGFIAQEVQEVMPELVTTFDTEDGERLGLEKEGIYAALVQAIKELKAEIDELKNK